MAIISPDFKLNNTLTAVVLAGGKSKRFGSPKSIVRFDGKNLIAIAIDLARQICNRTIIIKDDEKIPLLNGIKSFKDIHPGKGPIGGVQSALTFSETENIAILPVDMPLLCVEIYNHLASIKKINTPVVAISTHGMEPLVSIWSKSNLTRINQSIEKNILSLWKCLEDLNAIKLNFGKLYPEIPDSCFFNINTREDLDLLKKLKKNKN